jgi:acyl-CoA thioester hydrolase
MKLELPEHKKLVNELVIPIRWGDMDAMGHVNNTVYFRYMESIRIDWFDKIGFIPNLQGEGPVIANAFCNFTKQFEYPGNILVKLFLSEPRRTTFESWCTLERTDQPGVVFASGGATLIWVDIPKQKAVSLPDWVRALVSD